jgi:glycosyltransferase involved in cell wall biosynthesis
MRINFLGNTCNHGYWMAKWCRNLGHEAKLFISSTATYERDLPFWDDPDLKKGEVPDWVHYVDFPFGREFFSHKRRAIIYKDIINCDLIHSLSADALGGMLDFDIPIIYHSPGDIDRFYNLVGRDKPISSLLNYRNYFGVYRFRKVLSKIDILILSQFYEIPYGEKWVANRIKILPVAYELPVITVPSIEKNLEVEIRFFAPARQYNEKGNEIFICAYAELYRKYGNKIPRVLMLEWGEHLQQAKEMCHRLEIQHLVDWKPCLSKVELYSEMKVPGTVVFDQVIKCFPDAGSFGGVSRDALSVGAPLVTHFSAGNPYMYQLHKSKPPIFIVEKTSKEAVLEQLESVIHMKWDKLSQIGWEGRKWLEQEHEWCNVMPQYIQLYNEIITHRSK